MPSEPFFSVSDCEPRMLKKTSSSMIRLRLRRPGLVSCLAQSKSVPWATGPMAPSDWLGTSKNSNILNQPSAPYRRPGFPGPVGALSGALPSKPLRRSRCRRTYPRGRGRCAAALPAGRRRPSRGRGERNRGIGHRWRCAGEGDRRVPAGGVRVGRDDGGYGECRWWRSRRRGRGRRHRRQLHELLGEQPRRAAGNQHQLGHAREVAVIEREIVPRFGLVVDLADRVVDCFA